MSEFFQAAPRLTNTFLSDRLLRSHLARALPADVLAEVEGDLASLGEEAAGPMLELAETAERDEPVHVPFAAWGQRVDEVRMSPAWDALRGIACRRGLTALPYEGRYGEHSRVVQAAVAYLFAPSAATYLCPVAMTDAAARTLSEYGGEAFSGHVERLTSRDPATSWVSGQWMTEREGGSDVGLSSTVARCEDGTWRLYGTKWFTSAVTCDMALGLARPAGAPAGGRGLALFCAETKLEDGSWNGIRVNRLKEKLGTRALPTAELTLDGAVAVPVGDVSEPGIPKIATMLNLTRMHNALAAASGMARGLALARAFSAQRFAFGSMVRDLPLHAETLAWLATEVAGGFALAFKVAELCGRAECGTADADDMRMLRILTPLGKLFTGKQAVAVASEVLEVFGGNGYVEDTGLPRLLRDAQVLPLWEGTTNVLALDMLRSMAKDDAAKPLLVDLGEKLALARSHPALDDALDSLDAASVALGSRLESLTATGPDVVAAGARRLALDISRVYVGALLCEAAAAAKDDAVALAVAQRWARSTTVGPYPEAADLGVARLLAAGTE